MNHVENIWNDPSRVQALDRWESQSRALGQNVTDLIVNTAAPQPGECVLDVACGTGEPSLTLARMVGERGHVTGSDISARPLESARQRAIRQDLTNVEFVEADVHKLLFPDASFDLVTSRLGVMFFADLPQALSELRRVLKPAGRMVLLAWGNYEDQGYFQAIVDPIIKLLNSEFPSGAKKMFKFGNPALLEAALKNAGFKDVAVDNRLVPYVWSGTAEELWAYFQQFALPWKPLLAQIPDTRRDEVEAAIFASLNSYQVQDKLELKATVTLATTKNHPAA